MRFIFNPSTGNLESTDNVTSPLKPLGERYELYENILGGTEERPGRVPPVKKDP